MKKYSFRLRTLLRVREIFEEEAEREFRLALRELTVAVEKLEALRAELQRAVRELAAQQKEGALNILVSGLYQDYFRGLRRRIDDQLRAVAAAERVMEQRRNELLEKMRDRKSVDTLRMRDYENYLLELRHFEQKIIDDLATLRSSKFALISS